MEITINLPNSIVAASRGQSVTLDFSKLTTELIAQLVLHGAKQKISDAAAGAGKAENWIDGETSDNQAALRMMQTTVTNLENGEWGKVRGGGNNDPEYMPALLAMLRDLVRDDAAMKKAYKALDESAAKRKYLDDLFATFSDAKRANWVDAAEETTAEQKAADAKAKARLAKLQIAV